MIDNRERVIYKITNKINGKFYIGMSVNYNRRFSEHKRNPPTKMIKDVKKYSWDNFYIEVIIKSIIGEEAAFIEEIKAIEKHNPEYNSTKGGEGFMALHGENNPTSILKEIEVVDIRERINNGASRKEMCDKYYVSKSTIDSIVVGRNWELAPGPIQKISNKKGESLYNTKLSDKQAKDIREEAERGATTENLVDKYKVSRDTIRNIITGISYKHVSGPISKKLSGKGEEHPCSKITEKEVIDIRVRVNKGEPRIEIAKEFGISYSNVLSIVKGETWKDTGGPIQKIIKDNPNRKFTCLEAKEIRERIRDGEKIIDVANMLDCNRSTIGDIVNNRAYTECGGPIKKVDY